MEEPRPAIPQQFSSSQVVVRFVFRLALLIGVAAFSGQGFAPAFATVLAMSAIFCAVVAAMRGEAIFGSVLTHWDEAAIYAVMGHLVSALS